jgi:RIO kinase 1
MSKITREKFKTYGNVFDEFTLRNLFKLSSQGYFEDILTPIALGKESNVFSAIRKDGKKVIVKIYRLENCDFNKMYQYIKSDNRYSNISRSRRNVIFAWTQREFRNLHKARDLGVNVPIPLHFMHNILIEEFIGDDNPAPRLKDLYPKNINDFFKKLMIEMKKMHKGGLVHGDLSSFNILNWRDKPIIIDFSQSTEKNSSNYEELLKRDIVNVCSFFKKVKFNVTEDEIYDILNKK